MPSEEKKRKAVRELAEQITKSTGGKINSEQAHRMAVETAQRRERKEKK